MVARVILTVLSFLELRKPVTPSVAWLFAKEKRARVTVGRRVEMYRACSGTLERRVEEMQAMFVTVDRRNRGLWGKGVIERPMRTECLGWSRGRWTDERAVRDASC